jgi:hypothetical protein
MSLRSNRGRANPTRGRANPTRGRSNGQRGRASSQQTQLGGQSSTNITPILDSHTVFVLPDPVTSTAGHSATDTTASAGQIVNQSPLTSPASIGDTQPQLADTNATPALPLNQLHQVPSNPASTPLNQLPSQVTNPPSATTATQPIQSNGGTQPLNAPTTPLDQLPQPVIHESTGHITLPHPTAPVGVVPQPSPLPSTPFLPHFQQQYQNAPIFWQSGTPVNSNAIGVPYGAPIPHSSTPQHPFPYQNFPYPQFSQNQGHAVQQTMITREEVRIRCKPYSGSTNLANFRRT